MAIASSISTFFLIIVQSSFLSISTKSWYIWESIVKSSWLRIEFGRSLSVSFRRLESRMSHDRILLVQRVLLGLVLIHYRFSGQREKRLLCVTCTSQLSTIFFSNFFKNYIQRPKLRYFCLRLPLDEAKNA